VKIHPLQTGSVELKEAFLHPRPGLRGRLDLLLPGAWAQPVPILAYLIEHDERRILVDAGERSHVRNLPFARYEVTSADELPAALAAIGLTPEDIDTAVVTHLHSDHVDGAGHLRCPVLVHEPEWKAANSRAGRVAQRVTRAPIPRAVGYQTLSLDQGPFGAFAASRRLTGDGRVVAVSTPGHTAGHISVIAIDDGAHHVLIAGDVTDSLEQLLDRRPDAVATKPQLQIATIDRVIAHGREHPTVFLPAHDRESVSRLAAGTTL
jgi:glyoxylase-like metal-dependent hydrolase (beta-lactamase superfamily II)